MAIAAKQKSHETHSSSGNSTSITAAGNPAYRRLGLRSRLEADVQNSNICIMGLLQSKCVQ